MKFEDVKVGDKVLYQCGGDTDIGVVTEVDTPRVWAKWERSGLRQCSRPELLSLIEEAKFPLANTKINVQKYADDNGITLAAAEEEIQKWLYDQGCSWSLTPSTGFVRGTPWLEVGVLAGYPSTCITWSGRGSPTAKEITLQRTVAITLTPSFVEVPTKEAVEYVELGGKRYVKKELEEALSKIKAVEEGK